jgi:hypothetical protein
MAYADLETYIQAAVQSKESGLTDLDRGLLSKIAESLPKERSLNPGMLTFLPESSFFIIEGQVKVAVTGLNHGDPIYINRDRLQRFDGQNRLVDMSLLETVAILVHEFGHHQGVRDHSYLDRLGAIVADSARFDEYWMPLFLNDQTIGAQYLVPKTPWVSSTTLHFVDLEKHWDAQAEISEMSLCQRHFPGSKLKDLMLWNLFWSPSKNNVARFNAKLAFQCIDTEGAIRSRIGDHLTIDLPITKIEKMRFFDYAQKQIRIVDCSKTGEDQCEASTQAFKRAFSGERSQRSPTNHKSRNNK